MTTDIYQSSIIFNDHLTGIIQSIFHTTYRLFILATQNLYWETFDNKGKNNLE